MRFLKFLFFILIIGGLIAGGIFYTSNMLGWDWSQVWMMSRQQEGQGGHQQAQGEHGIQQSAGSAFNALANQNRDRLTQALTSMNQALDLVTTDPYAQITMPNRMSDYPRDTAPTPTAPGATPRDGVTINVNPGATPAAPARLPDLPSTQNIVFDQNKLEMLHNGIFKLAQAKMLLSELNNDLIDQSFLNEGNMAPPQIYTVRYALLAQNRSKLSQANRLLQDALILVNVNPYAPQSGYIYSTQKMQQLHQGISEMGRTTVMLNRLQDDFNQQLTQTAYESRLANVGMSSMVDHGGHGAMGGNFSISDLAMNMGLAVLIFAFLVWVLSIIRKMVREVTGTSKENR